MGVTGEIYIIVAVMIMHSPVTIGIAGGTGCGKSTVSNAIIERVGVQKISYLLHDAYYRDLSHMSKMERDLVDFDQPDALETALMVRHLETLKDGHPVEMPIYDFAQHIRTPETIRIDPRRVIIVDGVLIYADEKLRDLMDVRIYVDTDPDIRFIRRLQRDMNQRGRTVESVMQQYLATVRPGHIRFVEATKSFADVIIVGGGQNEVAIDMVVGWINSLMTDGK